MTFNSFPPLTGRRLSFGEKRAVILRVDELLELTYRSREPGEARQTIGRAAHPDRLAGSVAGGRKSVIHAKRVLSRLGLIPEMSSAEHRNEAEEEFPEGPNGQRLHLNLVHHGQRVCRTLNPSCGDCVLISFCRTGRSVDQQDPRPVAVELFAGAGGLGTGFAAEGFRIALAIESDMRAAQTYRLNHPGTVALEADVRMVSGRAVRALVPSASKPTAVIAGPPCQGYSAAGKREAEAEQNALFREVTRLAHELKARFVAIENVPGMRHVGGVRFTTAVIDEFRRAGYAAEEYLLRACDFGVPQLRHRIVFLAQLAARGQAPSQPEPTHCPSWAGVACACQSEQCGLPQTPTVLETLADLPLFGCGEPAEFREVRGRTVTNASTMAHSDRVVKKISLIEPGAGPISYRRLHKDLARTIVAGHRALPVHPTLDRTISVREAARIQGFEDSYTFCGPRAAQPLQVANAVPPPMASAIAKQLLALL
jgi:DNA (cytosine-5)-methyltransferase 1